MCAHSTVNANWLNLANLTARKLQKKWAPTIYFQSFSFLINVEFANYWCVYTFDIKVKSGNKLRCIILVIFKYDVVIKDKQTVN